MFDDNKKLTEIIQQYLSVPDVKTVKLSEIDSTRVSDVRDIHQDGVDKLRYLIIRIFKR
jgi:hypothetical protein